MSRLRLVLAIVVAENFAWISIVLLALLGLGVGALFTYGVMQIPTISMGSRAGLAVNLLCLVALPYTLLVIKTARALRARSLQDQHLPVARTEAPALYALIDDVARSLGVPAPRMLWLGSAFGAVARARRDGYDLLLGMTLLDALSVDELRAGIALGLARSYGGDALLARAYRCALRWVSLLNDLSARPDGGLAALVAALATSRFSADRFEERERELRTQIAGLLGSNVTAAAIARPAIYETYTNETFWPQLVARHDRNAQPPDGVSQLRAQCRAPLPRDAWRRTLATIAKDRALEDVDAEAIYREEWSPASALLPREVDRQATAIFDATWRHNVAAGWAAVHHNAEELEAELADLDGRVAVLSDEERWRRLELIELRRGALEVLPLYREWLAEHPDDARAMYRTGTTAVAARAADGIELLERAMERDARYEADAATAIATELLAQGRAEEATPYFERSEAASTNLRSALASRAKRPDPSHARPLALAAHERASLVEHLRRFPMIEAAYASSLEVAEFPTIACVVVAVRFNGGWSGWHGGEKDAVLGAIAGAAAPFQIVAIEAKGRLRAFTREPAAEIYRGVAEPRSVTLARWGRRAQRMLIGVGALLVVFVGFTYRDCFPGCWMDVSALLVLGPMIIAINALLLTGSPDTPRTRSVAFATSAFYAGMFTFGGAFVLLVPVAAAGFLRAPLTRRWAAWAVAMSVPAFVVGWMVTIV